MKRLTILTICFLFTNLNLLIAQDCDFEDKNIREKAKVRAELLVGKLNKDGNPKFLGKSGKNGEGFTPDAGTGTALSMMINVECHESFFYKLNNFQERKYITVPVESKGQDKEIATSHARRFARRQIIENNGSKMKGILERDEYFERINNSLSTAEDFVTFMEVFGNILPENNALAKFYRKEVDGSYTCYVIVAVDKEKFSNNIKNLSKKEYEKRLEELRKKLEEKAKTEE